MDREYLEDYEQKERSEYAKLIRRIWEGKFSFEKDRFPPDERFVKLQRPTALTSLRAAMSNLWTQIPFCGSLIIILPAYPRSLFERVLFKVSEIPKIIDFIKETGKLQIAIGGDVLVYEGLDYLDPFFNELNPPAFFGVPDCVFGDVKEIHEAYETFDTLGKVRFLDYLKNLSKRYAPRTFSVVWGTAQYTYVNLKLGHYAIVEDIENLMIDEPDKAGLLLNICRNFIVDPMRDLRSDLRNFTLEDLRIAQVLPVVYQPKEIRFPCEIGKFLLKKLTFAPQGLDACKELMYHYDHYDLQKALKALNEAIVTDHLDILNKSASELSEILDNIWKDPTIPRRVRDLKIGIPLSMAAIGGIAAGPVGAAAGGFLADLGFKVAEKAVDKFFDVKGEGISEKLAKLRTKSYQANIYDFKKKYKTKIAHQ